MPRHTDQALGHALLALARQSIAQALGVASPAGGVATPSVAIQAQLQAPGASFVTLTQRGQLRGCIGSLQAWRPLQADVQANAVAAALQDPRFAPLAPPELPGTCIEVSLLSAPEAMQCTDEADALAQLRPGVDGIVLEYGSYRSTFLPQVWEQLPVPAQFLAQLKRKAGLPTHFWAAGLRLSRYTVSHWKESAA